MPSPPSRAFVLACLVVLSGCSGLLPVEETTEAAPTPSAPPSYEEAVGNHSTQLREAGQFKLRWVRSVTFPDQVVNRSPVSQVLVADFHSDEYLIGAASAEQSLEPHDGVYSDGEGYQSGSTTWIRRVLENGTTVYRRQPPDNEFSVRKTILFEVSAMENRSKKFPLERNGTVVFQGERVTRYTADALGSAERCLLESRYVIENVTSVEVVALVDEDGIIRKFECRLSGVTITGERVTERRLWTITGIGVVEIQEPAPLVNETQGG